MCLPSGVAIDLRAGKGFLYVSDENNSRILRFTPPFGANPLPNLVLGQSTFTANYPNRDNICGFIFPASKSLSGPDQIATDALGNLYVGDTDNSRALEYNAPSVSGAAANLVFGQLGNFTGSDCNLDAEDRTIGAYTLCNAEGLAADTSATPNVYIADTQNNRILWFSHPLTSEPRPNRRPGNRATGFLHQFLQFWRSDAELQDSVRTPDTCGGQPRQSLRPGCRQQSRTGVR